MKNEFNFTPEETDFDTSAFLDGDSTSLEFNIGDFSFIDEAPSRTRYTKPKFSKKPVTVDYKNAANLAKEIKLFPGEQIHALVRGDFIFGDFIEALLVEKNAKAKSAYISTLSMSQNNVDSLHLLMTTKRIDKLTIMVSNYFYSHEKNNLFDYLLQELDMDNRLEVLVCRNHTKITLLEIENLKIVLSGSSNLRSSQSIEQFVLQENPELFDFYRSFFTEHEIYSIIDREATDEQSKIGKRGPAVIKGNTRKTTRAVTKKPVLKGGNKAL